MSNLVGVYGMTRKPETTDFSICDSLESQEESIQQHPDNIQQILLFKTLAVYGTVRNTLLLMDDEKQTEIIPTEKRSILLKLRESILLPKEDRIHEADVRVRALG